MDPRIAEYYTPNMGLSMINPLELSEMGLQAPDPGELTNTLDYSLTIPQPHPHPKYPDTHPIIPEEIENSDVSLT